MVNSAIYTPASADLAEFHRNAFNAAFRELSLRCYWATSTYRNLSRLPEETERVQAYLKTQQPHLLRAYDAEFLVEVIIATKARCYEDLAARGAIGSRQQCADLPEADLAEVGF